MLRDEYQRLRGQLIEKLRKLNPTVSLEEIETEVNQLTPHDIEDALIMLTLAETLEDMGAKNCQTIIMG